MAFFGKKKGPLGPFVPEPMAGRPMGALGEGQGDPRKWQHEPGTNEVADAYEKSGDGNRVVAIPKALSPNAPASSTPLDPLELLKEYMMRTIKTLPQTIAHKMSMTARTIGTTPKRIDVGIKDRVCILIANMSDVVIWIGHDSNIAAGRAYPLAANTAAGAYNGATYSVDCDENVEWWAVAASGATNLLLVDEASR